MKGTNDIYMSLRFIERNNLESTKNYKEIEEAEAAFEIEIGEDRMSLKN